MIVKCERCQTRFKIPDEKVTDKGVKVRCTKCQHTFRVAREEGASSASAPAPAVPPVEVPAVAKPPATPRAGTPIEAPRSSAPATSPAVPWGGAPTGKAAGRPPGPSPIDSLMGASGSAPAAPSAPGIAAPRGGVASGPTSLPRVSSMEPPKTPGTLDLDPLMEFIGENTPTPAQALQLAAKAPIPNNPAGALALGPVQAKPAAPASPAKGPSLSLSFDENDPFATPEEAPKAVAPAPKPVPARSAPPAPAPKPAPVPVQVPARSAAPAPKPAQAPAPKPAPAPPRSSAPVSFEENDPFALPPEDTVPATPTVPPRGAAPIPLPDSEEMEGLEGNNPFVSFEAAPTVPATPTLPPARSAAPAPVQPRSSAPVSFEEDDPFSLPPDNAPTMQATPTLPPSRSAAPVPVPDAGEMEGLEGNNPFVSFDPVAALPPAPAARAAPAAPAPSPAPAPSGIPDWGAPQQAAPSGIPDWGAPQQAPPSGIPDWGAPQKAPSGIPDWGATQTVPATPVARSEAQTERNPFPLPDFPGPGEAPPSREILPDLPAMTPTAAPPVIAAAPAAPAKKKEASDSQGPRIVQRLAAVAAQLVVAAVLVVGLVAVGGAWLNDGKLELSALSPAKMRELVSPTRPLVAKDLSNGLYETRDGRTLFFVRGEVENRGTAPVQVKALVAMYDGDQRVKSAEGLVGAVPTPEELYSLQKAEEATALRTRLDAAAKEVAPGARAPFVVFFYEYPSDLGGFRLEVTLEPRGEVAAAGGAKQGNAGNGQP